MAVTVDAVSTGYTASGTSVTWNHTIAAGVNYIIIALGADYGTTNVSCTVGGEGAVLLASHTTNPPVLVWALKSPPTNGVKEIVCTVGTGRALRTSALSLFGVNLDDATGTIVNSAEESHVCDSEDGWMCFDGVARPGTPGEVGAGQTQIVRDYALASSYEASAGATTTMSWGAVDGDWHISVPIKAAVDTFVPTSTTIF